MSEYPRNEKNNSFTWLSSLYNLFKTSKTLSRLFLVKTKDHLETSYGFSIRFKLLTYYHSIIRKTN